MDDLNAMLEKIRMRVFAEAEQRFADETFLPLRCLKNCRRMDHANGVAFLCGEGGNCMELYLRFVAGRVEEASYLTDGDSDTALCGSCAAELAVGKSCVEIMQLSAADIVRRASRSGRGLERSALLALTALQKAAEHYWSSHEGQQFKSFLHARTRYLAVRNGSPHLQYDN